MPGPPVLVLFTHPRGSSRRRELPSPAGETEAQTAGELPRIIRVLSERAELSIGELLGQGSMRGPWWGGAEALAAAAPGGSPSHPTRASGPYSGLLHSQHAWAAAGLSPRKGKGPIKWSHSYCKLPKARNLL